MLLVDVNSFVSCGQYSGANNGQMSTRSSADTLSKDPAEDAERLRELFKRSGQNQTEFAEKYGLGSQGQLWQLLNVDKKGGRPLNIMAAIKFAEGLNVRVSDFSPSLQEAIDRLVPFASESVKKVQEPGVKYRIEPENARRTDIATLLSIAETLNDAGLARLIERAEALAETHPARQQKQA